MRLHHVLAALTCFVLLPGEAQARNAAELAQEVFNPTGHAHLLTGTGTRNPISATVELSLPTAEAVARVPVVVLMPGAGGQVEEHLAHWRARLLAAGLGVLALDPLRVRGLAPAQSERLSTAADLADAFAALKALADHPRVDAGRIGILGFSRGGAAAWDAQTDAFAKVVLGPSSDLRFSAHAALYPPCHYAHVERRERRVPVLLVLAGADARTSPAHCRALARVSAAWGQEVGIVTVEGAQHAFDYFYPAFVDRDAFTTEGCRALAVDTAAPYPRPFFQDDGTPLLAAQGATPVSRILDWATSCRRPAAARTGNQNPSEREEATQAVLSFFQNALKR